MSEQLYCVFFSDDRVRLDEEPKDGEPRLLWKVVLRTGTWKMRPGPGGIKLKEPLKIYRDKAPKGHISMASLVKNFEAGAKENVTTVGVHADGTTSDNGFVRKLVIQDVMGEDGSKVTESLLWAGVDITDSAIRTKVEEKTLVGCSGGILFDYQRPRDAKKFDQILSHVTLTNSPWIDGTGGFKDKLPEGVMASEPDDLPVGEFELEPEEPEPDLPLQTETPGERDPERRTPTAEGTIVWRPNEGLAWIKGRVAAALQEQRRQLMRQFGEEFYKLDYPYYSVDDVSGNHQSGKALICSGYGPEKESWVTNYKVEPAEEGHDTVVLDAFQDWTAAKPEWVAASEDPDALPPETPARPPVSHQPEGESELRRAQRLRAERLGLSQNGNTNTGGTRMGRLTDLLADVQLSDEQREAIRREEEEAERLRTEASTRAKNDRESQAKAYLESLPAPFDSPGTKKYIQGILLGDDGGPAVESVELSDDGRRTHDKPLTATQVIKGLIDSLPRDAEGKLSLSSQAPRLPGDEKPPAENPETEDELDLSDEAVRKRADDLHKEAAGMGLTIGAASTSGGES